MESFLPRTTLLTLLAAATMLAGCKSEDEARRNGYVEGEFVYISATSPGTLQTLSVERGQQVKAGDALFALDTLQLAAERDAAQAALRQQEAQLANLSKGQRPEELNIIKKRQDEAEAALRNASREYDRSRQLAVDRFASRARLDADRAAFESAQARVAAVKAELNAAGLGARTDEIASGQAGIDAAKERLAQAEKRLREISPQSPEAAMVEDTYFRPGEFVPAGTPVVSLLPPQNIKIRFFIPQGELPSYKLGQNISIGCDGCAAPIPATVTYISSSAEFTPPVIYSVGSRDKLVFMIEAKPDQVTPALRPGLPVDIKAAP